MQSPKGDISYLLCFYQRYIGQQVLLALSPLSPQPEHLKFSIPAQAHIEEHAVVCASTSVAL